MWLIWIGVALMALHFAGIGLFAGLDYWWMLPFGLAFVWFEFIERPFGLDRKKGHDEMEKAKRKRIRLALGDKADSAQARTRSRK
jgi:small Trp-rich protein